MRLLIAAAGVIAVASVANAQTVIKETEAGVRSAPVAGATPNARQQPADDTIMLEKKTTTTVVEPRTTVRSGGSVDVESRTTVRE